MIIRPANQRDDLAGPRPPLHLRIDSLYTYCTRHRSNLVTRTALPDTAAAIQALHAKMSYRAMARELGLDHRIWPPTLRRIALGGTVSLYKENVVRRALGLPAAYPAMIETPACPDCGGVHTGRCNGIDTPVVIVKRQRPAKPAWVIEATANLARLLEDKP